jgi:hypothetical protein
VTTKDFASLILTAAPVAQIMGTSKIIISVRDSKNLNLNLNIRLNRSSFGQVVVQIGVR